MNSTRNKGVKRIGMNRDVEECMELTKEGWIFCSTVGFLETIIVLTICRIELLDIPLLVFLVLWAAFGIITSVFLTETGCMYAAVQSAVGHGSCQRAEQKEVWDMKKAS